MSALPESFFLLAALFSSTVTAGVVVTASVLVERASPFIGALVASLPIAASAAYIVLAIQHPPEYIMQSAIGSIATMGVNAIFGLAYAVLAWRYGFVVSLGGAYVVWAIGAYVIKGMSWTIFSALAFTVIAYAIAIYLMYRYFTEPLTQRLEVRRSDIVARAVTVALFIGTITILSRYIGSFVAGMLAIFPAVMSSFVIILHRRIGGRATSFALAQLQISGFAMSVSFVPMYFGVSWLGVWWGLRLGLVVDMICTTTLLLAQDRHARRRRASQA
jgi:hypothetical protein